MTAAMNPASRRSRTAGLASALAIASAVAGVGAAGPAAAQADPVRRLAGGDRITTSAVISAEHRAGAGTAGSVVLARGDDFADALTGTPLAVAKDGPLLLTSRDGLDLAAARELLRVLDPGGTVYLLGGEAALAPEVEREVRSLGYATERFAGADRFETALAVASRGLGDPDMLLLTTGANFPDALGAGAAAAAHGGAVVLTADATVPASVRSYLDAHPDAERFAVGGPAVAADPAATPLAGADRYATSLAVADRFFPDATGVVVTSGGNFPDALSGGAFAADRGHALLLSAPDALPDAVREHLASRRDALTEAFVLGGPAAVGEAVATAVAEAIR